MQRHASEAVVDDDGDDANLVLSPTMRTVNTAVVSLLARLIEAKMVTMQSQQVLSGIGKDLLRFDFDQITLCITARGMRVLHELIPMCDAFVGSSRGKERLRRKRRITAFCGGYVL